MAIDDVEVVSMLIIHGLFRRTWSSRPRKKTLSISQSFACAVNRIINRSGDYISSTA